MSTQSFFIMSWQAVFTDTVSVLRPICVVTNSNVRLNCYHQGKSQQQSEHLCCHLQPSQKYVFYFSPDLIFNWKLQEELLNSLFIEHVWCLSFYTNSRCCYNGFFFFFNQIINDAKMEKKTGSTFQVGFKS